MFNFKHVSVSSPTDLDILMSNVLCWTAATKKGYRVSLPKEKKKKEKNPLLLSSNLHWNELWPAALHCAVMLHWKHIPISMNARLSLLSRMQYYQPIVSVDLFFSLLWRLFQNAETISARYFINLFNSCCFAFSVRLTEQHKPQVKDTSATT